MGEVKLMIEVSPTWWLRFIATNIFGCTQLLIISNWTEIYICATSQLLNVLNPILLGHWTKIAESVDFFAERRHQRSTHGRAYPFEVQMQNGDLTNPKSFKCTDDLYEELAPNFDLQLPTYPVFSKIHDKK